MRANDGVSLEISAGTIHGIVGENGAGKSTLMSILYGFYQADAGEILIDGHAVRIRSTADAIAAGIGMVHQHFMLVDTFTVLENVVLGAEDGPLLGRALAHAREVLETLAQDHGLRVDPDAAVGELPVGIRQRVEILKALFRGARILVLDEPTGVLTPQEADALFAVLRTLRERGVTVILITHKLREIMAITDNVTVMRAGRVVGTRATMNTNETELAQLMVGRKVAMRVGKRERAAGEPVLEVDALRVRDAAGTERVRGVSFNVCSGEIVGIAGVSGNGQSELLEALAGIRVIDAGVVRIKGRAIGPGRAVDSADLREMGVAHVPEDRLRMGMVSSFTAAESAILGYHHDPAYRRGMLMDRRAVDADCLAKMHDFDVRPPDPSLASSKFSGGNQQKLVLAREMSRGPDLLLVGQPTRGVDIGAIEFLHQRLADMRDAGRAILLLSVELDEIMALSDRILVMFDGRMVGEVDAARATEVQLGLMMANASVSGGSA